MQYHYRTKGTCSQMISFEFAYLGGRHVHIIFSRQVIVAAQETIAVLEDLQDAGG